eukprot:TRINITY_DN10338_c0_g2_i1.p1 TRINITY_DN10338_c0_g2~~TRINITY_DN10338_c0_g2_i1.p1  ORF type:complete len:428 (-),score=65.38 TRINITY_DN10338_c0_g2_i1:262-1545(-)
MTETLLKSHSDSELANVTVDRLLPLDPNILKVKLFEELHLRDMSAPGTPTPIPTPERSENASPITPDPPSEREDVFYEHVLSQCLDQDSLLPKKVRASENGSAEIPDARIQNELERMNRSCDDINNLESQLTRNRNEERRILKEGNKKLKGIKLQISDKTVNTARFYYENVLTKKELQMRLNLSAIEYEKAKFKRDEARNRVIESECEYLRLRDSVRLLPPDASGIDHDSSFQHSEAIENVNTANRHLELYNHQVYDKQKCHKEQLLDFNALHLRLEEYRRKNHKSILKALPYFQAKGLYEEKQQDLLATRKFIQDQIKEGKIRYSVALKNLEAISLQIHNMRVSGSSCSLKIEFLNKPMYLLDGDSREGSYHRDLAHSRQSLRSLHSFKDLHIKEVFQSDLSPDKSNSMQCLKVLNKEDEFSLKLL